MGERGTGQRIQAIESMAGAGEARRGEVEAVEKRLIDGRPFAVERARDGGDFDIRLITHETLKAT